MIERALRKKIVERCRRFALSVKEGVGAAFPRGEFGSVGGAVSSCHAGHDTESQLSGTLASDVNDGSGGAH